jgi:hypothetical protein
MVFLARIFKKKMLAPELFLVLSTPPTLRYLFMRDKLSNVQRMLTTFKAASIGFLFISRHKQIRNRWHACILITSPYDYSTTMHETYIRVCKDTVPTAEVK